MDTSTPSRDWSEPERGGDSLPKAVRRASEARQFLNWHLVRYFRDRPNRVGFTRSRPYHKDDNGHVEQKNWTHVRQLLGYEQLEAPELCERINALYRDLWEPLHHYF